MRRSSAGRAAIIAAALLSFSACASTDPPTPHPTAPASGSGSAPGFPSLAGLRVESLPDGLQPSTLFATGDALFVAGHQQTSSTTRRPGLAEISDGRTRTVPLGPISPYAKVADLFSIAVDGHGITVVGKAYGGAHSNPRWTTWAGTAARVVERPQVFWTFGGEEAGALDGVVTTPSGPRILGSWQGTTALDIAIWRPEGSRWVRLDSAGTPLANTTTVQTSGRSAAPTPTGMVVAGSVLDLADGIRQGAAAWLSGSDGDWRLVRLPDPGGRSEALSARCRGSVCWIAGWVDGRLAAWRLDGDTAVRVADLPDLPIDVDGPFLQVVAAGPEPLIAYSVDGRTGLVSETKDGWVGYTGPAGELASAAEVAGRVYLATTSSSGQSRLWSAEAP